MNRLLTALLTAALLATPAHAQMDHSGHAMPGMTAAPAAPNLKALSGRAFDRAYLSLMVAHHQGALDMARAAQPRLKDARVKAWAAAVIKDQSREITQMTAWLGALGGVDASARGHMQGVMAGMIAPLRSAANADRAFVQGMLPHHQSALEMAGVALQRSSDPRVLQLSRDIVRAQAAEMYAYRLWLLR
ncbi:DUF305 domain-containing protein [Deinococcus radiotolerans]|uniref:DUF305 domain-containing protein n=1 Tax=Deinococcus radiotolerans TaxID=1309407 RepID=A0ABQ2FHP6_9DEIO|nr:DUF305 domain-containing protein [Deinococcus radiotolerans]GGK99068.1 hypothetical protein GCM10010844_16560 [Deinococcus radiotolerans]